jgi:E3 ubiquitin-protein ligase RNF14
VEDREQAELQRFVELALRDEEDAWDSDELGDDDEGFVIQ